MIGRVNHYQRMWILVEESIIYLMRSLRRCSIWIRNRLSPFKSGNVFNTKRMLDSSKCNECIVVLILFDVINHSLFSNG